MKTIKRLNIENKPDYIFTYMTNINDFDPKLILLMNLQSLKMD